jgi:acyl-coenzyme A synthetase/AMP-(fatty) acid ligase
MPQDRRIFLAIIATLKTGRIVLVLNGGDPPARIRQLLDDAEPTIILTVDSHWAQAQEIAGSKIGVINIDTLPPVTAESPKIEIGPDDIASLVYTSGSTGQPKGVMQTHGSILRNALDVTGAAGIVPEDRILLVASLWGGLALNTTWFTLVNGATLMSFPVVENGFTGLAEWLTKQRVSIFVSASSLFRHFMKSIDTGTRFPHMRLVKLSADPATREDFEKVLAHFPNSILMHSISLTETGNLAYMMLTRDAVIGEGQLPVGRPFDSVDLRILDEEGRDCPSGTIGTISAGHRYLAAGYWRDTVITAKHFFEGPRGTRVYRGGDLAFVNDEGLIVFVGRTDATFKIRGQLVDLTEVERGLAGIPGVRGVAVVGMPRPNGETSLVAYVVSSPGLTSRRLRSAARSHMAGHLVPSFFVFIEALPRSANGKVDRTQLRENARPLLRDAASSLPATETEALMAHIWAEALDLEDVGRMEDFFELGGDSLVATVIAARLHDMMRIELDFGAFVEFPILKDFATFVDETRPIPNALPLSRLKPDEPAPLSVVQEYYWRRSLDPTRSAGLTMAAAWRIEGPLDISVLRQSLNDVAARHDILRTRFKAGQWPDDVPFQSVQPPGEVPLPFVDLSEMSDAETRFEAVLDEERKRHFDLSAAPPVSFKLLRLRSDCHVLLRSAHHIVADGPSWNIFLQDLAHIYDARLRGKHPSLPPLAIQYADYSAWERERWRRGSKPLHEAAAWWRRELEDVPRPPESGWLTAYMRREPAGELSSDDWSIPWGLELNTSERLDRLGRFLNATYFAVRLAGLIPVCAMATGQDKVLLAAVRSTRTRAELQPIVGPFISYAPLNMSCDWNWAFRDLVVYARQKLIDVQRNAEAPYSLLIEELKAQGIAEPRPLLLVHKKAPRAPVHFGDLKLTRSDQNWHPMRPGIMVRFDEIQEHDGCLSVFDARVYSTELMREFVDCLAGFLQAAAKDPEASIRSLIETDGIGDRLRQRRI